LLIADTYVLTKKVMQYKAHFASATGDAGQSGDPLLVG